MVKDHSEIKTFSEIQQPGSVNDSSVGVLYVKRQGLSFNVLVFRLFSMNWVLKFFLFLSLLFFITTLLTAQDRVELGGFLGTSYYAGDFNPGTPFVQSRPAFGAFGRYAASDRWAFRGSFLFGSLKGSFPIDDLIYNTEDNATYQFSRNFTDVALMSEFNFLSYDHRFLSNTVFTPYITAGIAMNSYTRYYIDTPTANGETVFVLSLPFGAGVKYKLTNWVRIGFEWTMRKTFVDDLDYTGGVTLVNPTDPYGFGQPNSTHNNDWISFAGVTVTFNMLKRNTACKDGFR